MNIGLSLSLCCSLAWCSISPVMYAAEEVEVEVVVADTASVDVDADVEVGVAGEKTDSKNISVARVNNHAITLYDLEAQLIRQEGADTIEDIIRKHLQRVDWTTVADEDTVVSVAGLDVPRVLLASTLLDEYGTDVRGQLIQQQLIQQALEQAEIVFDDALKSSMYARMERVHYQQQEEKGGDTTIPFETVIEKKYNMTVDEWQQDPGFAFLAGTFALMYETMDIPESIVRSYFEDHMKRYSISEGYSISVIPIPFAHGASQAPVTEAGKRHVRTLAANTYASIHSGRRSFASTVRHYDKDFKGARGVVLRDGSSEVKGRTSVDSSVMEAVFRHHYAEFPTLLQPIETATHVSIVLVESYRKGTRVTFEACKKDVRMDVIDSDTNKWMTTFLHNLRNAAEIDYASMPEIQRARKQDLQTYIADRQQKAAP